MAAGQGGSSRGENSPLGAAHTSCPSCRRVFVATSREQKELESTGQICRPCKQCQKALVVVLRPDGGLDVTLDFTRGPESPRSSLRHGGAAGEETGGSLSSPSGRQPPGDASLRGSEKMEGPTGTVPILSQPLREGVNLPRSLAKLNQAIRTADEKLGTALTAIHGMHGCLEEIQAAQGKMIRAQLSEKSHKAMEETVAACNRLERLSEKLEGAASRIFGQVQSKVLAPDGLRGSLGASHDWRLEQRDAEEEYPRIIGRLPDLFDFVEMELRDCRAAEDASLPSPAHGIAAAKMEKLHERMKDWQRSMGLVRFPEPGDAFDSEKHDVDSVVVTDDATKADSVKEVVRSGYRLGNDGPLLRRALVVCWVKPRGTCTAHG